MRHLGGVEDDQHPARSDVDCTIVAFRYVQARLDIGTRHREAVVAERVVDGHDPILHQEVAA